MNLPMEDQAAGGGTALPGSAEGPQSTPSRARSRSASSMTIMAFLPPISSDSRLCIRPQASPMSEPVSVEPVKEMTGTAGMFDQRLRRPSRPGRAPAG